MIKNVNLISTPKKYQNQLPKKKITNFTFNQSSFSELIQKVSRLTLFKYNIDRGKEGLYMIQYLLKGLPKSILERQLKNEILFVEENQLLKQYIKNCQESKKLIKKQVRKSSYAQSKKVQFFLNPKINQIFINQRLETKLSKWQYLKAKYKVDALDSPKINVLNLLQQKKKKKKQFSKPKFSNNKKIQQESDQGKGNNLIILEKQLDKIIQRNEIENNNKSNKKGFSYQTKRPHTIHQINQFEQVQQKPKNLQKKLSSPENYGLKKQKIKVPKMEKIKNKKIQTIRIHSSKKIILRHSGSPTNKLQQAIYNLYFRKKQTKIEKQQHFQKNIKTHRHTKSSHD